MNEKGGDVLVKKKQVFVVVSISVVICLVGTMFNVMATDGGGNPWNRVWEAIYGLQSRVEALESEMPKKGYISISPAAFNPTDETSMYILWGSVLEGEGYYVADVQLPHGATVTNMTVYVYDESSSYGLDIKLYKYNLDEHHWCIASIDTWPAEETPGYAILYAGHLLSPEVDNQHYSYYIAVWFDGWSYKLELRGIVIEYEYQAR